MVTKLSKLQKTILVVAYECWLLRPPSMRKSNETIQDCFHRDLLRIIFKSNSNAAKASLSRAVRRLENRGLVQRIFWCFHNDYGFDLTQAGLSLAKGFKEELLRIGHMIEIDYIHLNSSHTLSRPALPGCISEEVTVNEVTGVDNVNRLREVLDKLDAMHEQGS